MLRVLKILNYLVEKFANTTKEMKDKNLIPSDWLVLQCKGQELNNDLTLQTIKPRFGKVVVILNYNLDVNMINKINESPRSY